MIVWGAVLVAIGIGALLDWRTWPVVFIAVGAGLVFAAISGIRRWSPTWFRCCGPWYAEGTSAPDGKRVSEVKDPPAELDSRWT